MPAKWCPHCTGYHYFSDRTLDLKRHIAVAHGAFGEPLSIKFKVIGFTHRGAPVKACCQVGLVSGECYDIMFQWLSPLFIIQEQRYVLNWLKDMF